MANILNKRLIYGTALLMLVVAALVFYYKFFAATTRFSTSEKHLYIYSNQSTPQALEQALLKDSLVRNISDFRLAAKQMGYYAAIKPGHYIVASGMSVTQLIRKLKRGVQDPEKLVIVKLRLPGDFAKLIGKRFECDSAQMMDWLRQSGNLQRLGLDTNTWAAAIIPNTYNMLWTWPPGQIMERLHEEQGKWWNRNGRIQKAEVLGLTPTQVYIVASIVEEETNMAADKPLVASVYLNRLQKRMPLQADPTIRFALKDFAMNRVLYGHLAVNSPFNTYRNTGLPPGPICTPSPATIDSVLAAPKTDYIFFVANANLRGGSTFTTNLADHSKAAHLYQDSLVAWLERKAARQKALKNSGNAKSSGK
jgi:UPF0755 protein